MEDAIEARKKAELMYFTNSKQHVTENNFFLEEKYEKRPIGLELFMEDH